MSNHRKTGIRARVQSVDWVALRRAFIERPERPLLADLSAEFGVSVERISRAQLDEGWSTLRAAHLGERLKAADAALAVLNAAKADAAVTSAITNTALEVIREVNAVVMDVSKRKQAENTRANTLNTCGFVLSNLANALARVGVVGLPKALKESAGVDNGNGRWNPQMLQALNVTVQNIMAAAPAAAPAPPLDAIPDVPAAAEGGEQAPALPEPAGVALEVPAVERESVPADVI